MKTNLIEAAVREINKRHSETPKDVDLMEDMQITEEDLPILAELIYEEIQNSEELQEQLLEDLEELYMRVDILEALLDEGQVKRENKAKKAAFMTRLGRSAVVKDTRDTINKYYRNQKVNVKRKMAATVARDAISMSDKDAKKVGRTVLKPRRFHEETLLAELSNKLLRRYKTKATSSMRKNDNEAQRAFERLGREEDRGMSTDGTKNPEKQKRHMDAANVHLKKFQKHDDIANKRRKGISTASKKIAARRSAK